MSVGGTAGRALTAQEQSEPLDQRIDRLIEQLGDEDFFVREQAQQALAELGFDAYDALNAAATHEDLEIATRAKYLIRLIPARWSIENEPEEIREYLRYYRSYSAGVRIQVLQLLADWPRGIGVPSLCRLVRFEKSTVWSKHAAVQILLAEPMDPAGRARWPKTLRDHVGRSGRPAARWLESYLKFREDPKQALLEWRALVEEEQALLERSPEQSSPRIVAALRYHLAMAQADQGDEESAEKTSEQARRLGPDPSAERLDARIDTAAWLERRGKFRWAESEYRAVVDAGDPKSAAKAQVSLSDGLHDRGEDLAAAEACKAAVELIEAGKVSSEDAPRLTPGQLRARMNFYYACHAEAQGDRSGQRAYLDEAIREDPAEFDSLIARYRLPDPEPEYHRKTLELIEQAASGLRAQIEKYPDEPVLYNQLAWLIGNTEGDLDEALRCSKKAVEMRPESGAFLDTLAHVYFGRGDLENAVKHQAKAIEFEPHSGLIVGKLKDFRQALNERKKDGDPKAE